MVLKTGPDRPVTVLIWSDELDRKVIESESDRVNRTNQPVPSELLGSFFFPPGIRATVPLLPATGVLSCWQHPSQNAAKPRRRPLNTPPPCRAPLQNSSTTPLPKTLQSPVTGHSTPPPCSPKPSCKIPPSPLLSQNPPAPCLPSPPHPAATPTRSLESPSPLNAAKPHRRPLCRPASSTLPPCAPKPSNGKILPSPSSPLPKVKRQLAPCLPFLFLLFKILCFIFNFLIFCRL